MWRLEQMSNAQVLGQVMNKVHGPAIGKPKNGPVRAPNSQEMTAGEYWMVFAADSTARHCRESVLVWKAKSTLSPSIQPRSLAHKAFQRRPRAAVSSRKTVDRSPQRPQTSPKPSVGLQVGLYAGHCAGAEPGGG